MTHEQYMQKAIGVAKQSEQEGGVAIGAILVDDTSGEIVATGKSLVWQEKDPSAHAETYCIRNACKKLQTLDLTGYTLYGTLEPCHMCLSCAAWAKLPTMYFGAYRTDTPGNPYEIKGNYSAEESAQNIQMASGNDLKIQGGILREECAMLFEGYKDWTPPQENKELL